MIGLGPMIKRFFIMGHEGRIVFLASELQGAISINTVNISPNEAFIMHHTLYANKITFASLVYLLFLVAHHTCQSKFFIKKH
ncbi:hypothetical protein GCM10009110_15890 [Psychrobacter piscatorii]